MTQLRQRMSEDMQVRNFALNTQLSYLQQVSLFARHFGKSPDLLGREDIRTYQVYLTNEKKLSPGSIHTAIAALRFLYSVTLERDWAPEEVLPLPKKPQKLPIILSPEEVQRFLGRVLHVKHHAILTTCYAAGLRISEAVQLKPTDIDSQRMVIRVEQGKGQKDRYVMLSPKLLEILRNYWKVRRPEAWLFPGDRAGQPITKGCRRTGLRESARPLRIVQTGHAAQFAARLCRASVGGRRRRAHHSTAARSQESRDHRPLPADRYQQGLRHVEPLRAFTASSAHPAAAHQASVLLSSRRWAARGRKWRTYSVATARPIVPRMTRRCRPPSVAL